MNFCPDCHSEIPEASRFCPQCGAPQSLACVACGHVNAAGSHYCARCGAKLGEMPAAATPPKPTPTATALDRAPSGAERRQLTVMFCDMVGSTALSTKLDPEDLRDVIAAYHKCASEVVSRFSGFVAKYMGDGVLIYFGYPEAHEADADNAVRAALAIVEAVDHLAIREGRHQVRLGIATGPVVVGELVGSGEAQERNVVGETPNLAARLQSAAVANSVLIDASTRRLAGDLFEYEAVDPGVLKGFDGTVTAWRVLRERTMQSRFEALRAATLAPLVGREEELELLLRRWQRAKEGEGRVILLSGEPGVGKSRLTAALTEQLADERPITLRYFCLPHQQGSVLQPIIGQLQHAAGFARDDTPGQTRAKLEKLLARGSNRAAASAKLLTELMGLDQPEEGATPLDPKRKRNEVLAALIEQLENLARKAPVMMVFEDAHWSDPTSLELLTLTIERMQALPILLIITHRPDFQPPWAGQPHVTSMMLNRLSRRESMTLIGHITGRKTLPQTLVDQIVERADGVPLFLEELIKAVLESDGVEHPERPLAIPTTLQASLMARVDRLGSARDVLQIGSAIGREFSYDLIAAVAGLPDAVLQDALARLTEAELLLIRGAPPISTYVFKHALVQDTAYSTMVRRRRQALHSAIAQVLENRFPDTAPEVLAQQFQDAGRNEKAIQYWRQAGDRDMRRFAMKESISHYTNAFRIVMSMPDTPARIEQELAISLALGLVHQIALGPASKECATYYERAHTLSQSLPGRGREGFLATWGLWFNRALSGRHAESYQLADALVTIARELDDSDLLLEAYHASIPGLQWKADFIGMKEASRQVIRRYDRMRHRDHAYFFGGHDARVCAQGFYSMCLWALGFFDQAHRMGLQAIEDAHDLGHIYSVAHALYQAGTTFMLLQDVDGCQAIDEELFPIADRNKFPMPLAHARFLRGWLLARHGDRETGVDQMLEAAAEPVVLIRNVYMLMLIAEQQFLDWQHTAALDTLGRAMSAVETMQNHFCEPEIIRLRGSVLLQQSRNNEQDAEAAFQRAIEVTRAQSCRAIELRAVTSLARLRRDQGRRQAARDLLAPVYEKFSEGFKWPDLRAAKALLEEVN